HADRALRCASGQAVDACHAARRVGEVLNMRAAFIALSAMLLVWTAAPRGAQACGQGSGAYAAAYVIAITTLSVDAGFTLWDAGSAALQHEPSAAYGVVELLLSAPQFALGAANFNRGAQWYTVWTGALTAHAIWTIARSVTDSPVEPQSHAFSVGPSVVPVGQKT